MQLRFFAIPVLDPAAAEAELNALLAVGRVAGGERQFVAARAASYWSVIVTLADGPGPLPAGLKVLSDRRTDYREMLSEPDFAVCARLRILRKQVADVEVVSPYLVFNNKQLARMVCGWIPSSLPVRAGGLSE